MPHAPLIPPLPLADADDVVKVVIGAAFALMWIIAQVASSAAGAKKKKDEARLRQALSDGVPAGGPGAIRPPASSAPRPPRGNTDLERQLRDRRQQAEQFRSGHDMRPPIHTPDPTKTKQKRPRFDQPAPAQSYEELRRRKQHAATAATVKPVRRNTPPPRPPAAKSIATSPAPGTSRVDRAADGARASGGTSVTATEIGGDAQESGPAGAATASAAVRRVKAMLAPRAARDVFLAAELLRPPVALRDRASP